MIGREEAEAIFGQVRDRHRELTPEGSLSELGVDSDAFAGIGLALAISAQQAALRSDEHDLQDAMTVLFLVGLELGVRVGRLTVQYEGS